MNREIVACGYGFRELLPNSKRITPELTRRPTRALLHSLQLSQFVVTLCWSKQVEIFSALMLVIPRDANRGSIRDFVAYSYLWLDEGAYG